MKGGDIILNQIILVGRLTRDISVNKSEKGVKVATISLAIPRSFKNMEGGYDTDFIDILPETVTQAFIRSTHPGEKLYAIDWFHSYFLYDPRNPDDGQSVYVEDATHPDGGYRAYFPGFYPDGDYFFFIDQHFRFGYLAHPWREEVWIFGQPLIAEFEQIYSQLGWIKKQDFS